MGPSTRRIAGLGGFVKNDSPSVAAFATGVKDWQDQGQQLAKNLKRTEFDCFT